MASVPTSDRVIPIERMAVPRGRATVSNVVYEDVESGDEDVPSESNRTSLIITHEDGTTEENIGLVTNLGVSGSSDDRGSVSIEEIGQETLARKLEDKKIRVVLPDAASLIVEQVIDSARTRIFECKVYYAKLSL